MNRVRSAMNSVVPVVILLLATALMAACGRESPEKLMSSAKEYLAKGDRSAAVIQLKNLLSSAPDNGEARLLLGQALLDAGDYVSAEKELSRALELRQPQERVVPAYAQALLSQGKYQDVIAVTEKHKLFDPSAVSVTQTALGDAYRQLGDAVRASGAYSAALSAVPGHPRARLGEAILIAAEGRLDDASKQIDEVIAIDPKLAEAHAFRADILLARGDRSGAKKALTEAIEADDRFVPARLVLIRLLEMDRDFEAASKLVDSTKKVAPGDLRLNLLDASIAYRTGDYDKARQQVQLVLKYLPDDVPSMILAGAIDLQQKRLGPAEVNLSKAVARAPNHLGARKLLVQTYLQMGQPARAKEVLQPVIDRGLPTDPGLLLLAGETFLANGNVQQATTFYRAAAKKPDTGTEAQQVVARTRLGQIAIATGKAEEGFKELEAASELNAGAYQADLSLIAGHLSRKEVEKAMEAVRALEKKQPKNPLTFHMYGIANLAKGDLPSARKSFERALELDATYLASAYNLAQLDILAKKPDDARKRYEAMIARAPNNEQVYLALAQLQSRTGSSASEIAATLQRAISANPQAPTARLELINLQLRAGDAKAALAAAQDAAAAMPNDARILDAVGVAQETAGEVNQAIETYNKLAALQPRSPQPLMRLAALHVRQNQTDKAIESLRRVQKVAPRQRDVVPELVRVYVAAGRYDDAVREARELQRREPNFAGGYSLEGDAYFAQRKFSEAEKAYRKALSIEPRANVVAIKLHATLTAADKPAEADSWAKKWIADNPKDTAMRLHLGDAQLAAKNLKAALGHYLGVVALEPNNVPALNNLAWISGELNDPKALGYAERALKLAPSDAAVLDTYGMLLMKKGDAVKALPFLERASKSAPGRYGVRLNYAKALIASGRKDDARKELEALQVVNDNFSGKDEVAGLLKAL